MFENSVGVSSLAAEVVVERDRDDGSIVIPSSLPIFRILLSFVLDGCVCVMLFCAQDVSSYFAIAIYVSIATMRCSTLLSVFLYLKPDQ